MPLSANDKSTLSQSIGAAIELGEPETIVASLLQQCRLKASEGAIDAHERKRWDNAAKALETALTELERLNEPMPKTVA